MPKDLSNYRKTYQKQALLEANCPNNPMDLFQQWFTNADNSNLVDEANAMTIATNGVDGFPKNRVVLLKAFDQKGFVFYTNYNSEKGKAIEDNNKVCLSFFWAGLEQQIIIKGTAEKTSEKTSTNYFESRPIGSQLGAIASAQSQVVASRDVLDAQLASQEKKHENKTVKRPKHWGGYCVTPISIEFWQGRPNRMHDRIRYTLQKDFSWKMERLQP